ncbi:hypothetical protein PY254_11400 [Rhodanobacter sp. AS-Z3]|uniref:hypothetical protein n=1 Tax=Rhodanobacter sp. AS-Z3 TaxID=3031330 RepID=UPI002478349E|nr:hypothetical protein [Rhodanobacter sp. AS-Z3]WEN13848.1 hypothetical protein PY254_11400 [Rhodanobacter sp. AS-Z3]
MSEMRLEPPTSAPPPFPPDEPRPGGGSLAAGVALAWAVMIIGEMLILLTHSFGMMLGGMLLPPVAIVAWGLVLLNGSKPRTGKGLLLGLVSIVAVVLLLVAACFGLISNYH